MKPEVMFVLELTGILGFAYAVWGASRYFPVWITAVLTLVLLNSLLLTIQIHRRRPRNPESEKSPW